MKTTSRWVHKIIIVVLTMVSSSIFLVSQNAFAVPAFALREKASCTLCHTNGSVPHLTKTGYLYRRSGYRFPADIGNLERDERAMNITEHLAAGMNSDYEFETNKAAGDTSAKMSSNQFDVREVEIFPLVGGFKGNFGVFSEVDGVFPSTGNAGGVSVSHAELVYVRGNSDFYFNTRVGLMTQEGYGASDQWIDDGNLPLFDQLSAQYFDSAAGATIDTLALPLGANGRPQLGAEIGLNYNDSHFTLGVYNGQDGTASAAGVSAFGVPAATAVLTANLMKQTSKGTKDIKLQLDQFLLDDRLAFTATYYRGTIGLLNPTHTFIWTNHYTDWRLYLTGILIPQKLDLLAGFAMGTYEMLNSATTTVWNQFRSQGVFVGANYYVMPHLTLSGHVDQYQFDQTIGTKVLGYSLMASLPFDNNIFVFHFNSAKSDNGVFANNGNGPGLTTNQFRAEWRFLF